MDLLDAGIKSFGGRTFEQPALLEVFAGSARLTGAFAAARRGVLRPRDLPFGDDLRQEEVRQQLYDTIGKEKPQLVWFAPPCTDWCGFSRLNHTKQELRRRRQKQKIFLKMINEVLIQQMAEGRDVVIENPLTSDLWRDPLIAPWCEDVHMSFFRTDLCQFGMRSKDGEQMIRKPIKLLATNSVYEEVLKRRCDDHHEHRVIQGQETSHSAEYPEKFAEAVVEATKKIVHQNARQVFTSQAGSLDDLVEQMELDPEGREVAELPEAGRDEVPGGAADLTFKGTVSATIAGALRRLHQNLGHPPPSTEGVDQAFEIGRGTYRDG